MPQETGLAHLPVTQEREGSNPVALVVEILRIGAIRTTDSRDREVPTPGGHQSAGARPSGTVPKAPSAN